MSTLADYADAADALLLGYTAYQSIWETDDTAIKLFMAADNNEISTAIFYDSKTIETIIDTSGL
jgi:hypothetical protein